MSKNKPTTENNEFTYTVKGKNFIVRPVYKDDGTTIDKALLRLMCHEESGHSGRVQ